MVNGITLFVARGTRAYGIGFNAREAVEAMLHVLHAYEPPSPLDHPSEFYAASMDTRRKREAVLRELVEHGSVIRVKDATALRVDGFGIVEYLPSGAEVTRLTPHIEIDAEDEFAVIWLDEEGNVS